MRFRHELRYDAAPEQVYAMLGEPRFREKVCEALHAHDWDVSVDVEDTSMTVAVDHKRPSEGVPAFARKLVGEEIHIAQRETWSGPASARLEVLIPHRPGQFTGTIALAADGPGTVETIDGDVKVSVPLVGGRLEALIGQLLEAALRREQRVGHAWLADRG